MPNHQIQPANSQFILYKDVSSHITINVRFDGDDVWLTQPQIAALFHTTRQNIDRHIRNIYQRSELQKERTCKNFLQVQNEGSRSVRRYIAHYDMDMIIAVVCLFLYAVFFVTSYQICHYFCKILFVIETPIIKEGRNNGNQEI
jgi:hypothetical protein